MNDQWFPNPLQRPFLKVTLVVFPLFSLVLFLITVYGLPAVTGGPVKWPVVLLGNMLPWFLMLLTTIGELQAPRQIKLEPEALVWETDWGRRSRVSRERVVRLQLIDERRNHSICVYLNDRGREQRIPITMENQERIRRWLEAT